MPTIDRWVVRQALDRVVHRVTSGVKPYTVAVNLSGTSLNDERFLEFLIAELSACDLATGAMCFEITETAVLDNQEAHLATIRRLKNLGISMALDDFGTGYSAVKYLTIFPFDKSKIDKSFTQGVLDRRDCQAVIASTLALAQGLGIAITAEGIETEAQFDYMRKAGINLAQGYLGEGLREIAGFVVIIVVLMLRPYGLFGSADIERV